jgi:hypothetical protein
MRARAAKMPARSKNINHIPNIAKKGSKNIKTEHCYEDTAAPMNHSIIYTKRSSLDDSLYDKALRDESARKSWVAQKKRDLSQEEIKECSYHPLINPTSKAIMDRLDKQQIYDKIKRKKEESIKRSWNKANLNK